MCLQEFLVEKFRQWSPPPPEILGRTQHSVTLQWAQIEPYDFIADRLLFRLEKDSKVPRWFVVYRGGKTKKEIDYLTPRHPHKFRLKIIVQAEAVATLVDRAVQFYGSEDAVLEKLGPIKDQNRDVDKINIVEKGDIDNVANSRVAENIEQSKRSERGDEGDTNKRLSSAGQCTGHKWIESQWSEVLWTNTDTDGTSIVCFCMAVHCGYIKQVQGMLEERPELIGILNPTNGFTPLATAVRKGDLCTVRFLLSAGAQVNQRSSTGQTPLHLAVLARRLPIVDLLLEKGADFQACDVNGLRIEHYSVDSCDVQVVRHIFDKGGDVNIKDNNGWTPLFRALCQAANTAIIEELVVRGSDLEVIDKAGLPLTSVARVMTNRHGHNRDFVLRLVDSSYPREIAMENFSRLTKKIYNVHTVFKQPSLTKKHNLRE